MNWDSSGGGAFAVIPLSVRGKLPDQIPLFRGHTATVLDTDWNPFDDSIVASSSDDGTIAIWKIPDDYKIVYEDPEDIQEIAPLKKLTGHARKVGHIQWHPVAENVLASSSADYSVKIWDVDSGKTIYTLPHKDIITSFAFNADGSLIATACRDKKIRVWDVRAEKILSEGPGHGGSKACRIDWMGPYDRIVSAGFSRMSDRQFAVWDTTDIAKGPINDFHYYDSSSGILIPFFDADTNCLYLAGKGDGNIRYFEFENDQFFPLSEYQSIEPQRGLAFLPKRAVNVKEHEVVRVFKSVRDNAIEPISFIVPRRAETFQDDIYPPAYAGVASLTAAEWIAGKNAVPKVVSLQSVFDNTDAEVVDSQASKEVPAGVKPKPSAPQESANPKQSVKASSPEEKEKATPAAPGPLNPASPLGPGKKDVDDLLHGSKHVDKLLAKANETEETVPEPLKGEESVWEEEKEKPAPREVKAEVKPAPKEVKAEEKPTPKEETPTPREAKEVKEEKPEVKKEPTSLSQDSTQQLLAAIAALNTKLDTLLEEVRARDHKN